MIDNYTGEFRMLDVSKPLPEPAPGELLVFGSESEVQELSRRVKLGAAELEARKRRRKAQRAARKRSR